MSEFKFADSVWHRIVQCIQEGMLTGTDVSDSLRQVRVTADEDDPHVLVLTADYQKQVREMHEKMLQQAKDLQAQQVGHRFIVPGSTPTGNESN